MGSTSVIIELNFSAFFTVGAPATPRYLTLLSATHNSITISWMMPFQNGTNILVSFFLEIEDPLTALRIGMNLTSYQNSSHFFHTFHDLRPGVQYRVQLYAYNDGGRSPTVTGSFATIALGVH